MLCLQDVKIAFIAAGSAAAHCIVGDVNGVCYTWGRNEVLRLLLLQGVVVLQPLRSGTHAASDERILVVKAAP